MRAMTRLDVAHGASHRLQVAANTVYKQYRNGQAIWVYCTDPKRLASFSKMLWSIEDTEFVPTILFWKVWAVAWCNSAKKIQANICLNGKKVSLNKFRP